MAKFLNTSATNYFLEELIKGAKDRLVLISPFLKLNDRIKELLEDKNRLKIDVRIVYGKSELQPQEIEWLKGQSYIRTSFCKNLHAKCYLNEENAIVTSLNLYEFSQINNNEMGILIRRDDNAELYKDTYEEAQRIIRISDEVRISMERVSTSETEETPPSDNADSEEAEASSNGTQKLSTSKIAQKHGMKAAEWLSKAVEAKLLTAEGDRHYLTPAAKQAGIEFVAKSRFGPYFLWPENVPLHIQKKS
ncbi:ATPase involved in DNA repair [Comamonas thiooxydans]|uniref:ATPase involved in DNA repair n=1 Tax=Comamonas thiooxydans TaxID=363952 RepID=A0A0E3BU86_9BURK|nr:phospholipase D family protein [Comamonas thiooxydans]KGG82235.1 ATPase involved in DNA repair [Comamonas thiooxydans]